MRVAFLARGRVQGVGFRAFVRSAARDLDLAGWVRNEADGAVRGEAAGDLSRLEALRAQLEQGPPGSRVLGMDWSAALEDGEDLPRPFEIRR